MKYGDKVTVKDIHFFLERDSIHFINYNGAGIIYYNYGIQWEVFKILSVVGLKAFDMYRPDHVYFSPFISL